MTAAIALDSWGSWAPPSWEAGHSGCVRFPPPLGEETHSWEGGYGFRCQPPSPGQGPGERGKQACLLGKMHRCGPTAWEAPRDGTHFQFELWLEFFLNLTYSAFGPRRTGMDHCLYHLVAPITCHLLPGNRLGAGWVNMGGFHLFIPDRSSHQSQIDRHLPCPNFKEIPKPWLLKELFVCFYRPQVSLTAVDSGLFLFLLLSRGVGFKLLRAKPWQRQASSGHRAGVCEVQLALQTATDIGPEPRGEPLPTKQVFFELGI